jgi:hypothetical protein
MSSLLGTEMGVGAAHLAARIGRSLPAPLTGLVCAEIKPGKLPEK